MSRVLKASYINVDNNVIIDNRFYPPFEVEKEQQILEEPKVEPSKTSEEIEIEIQKIIDKANKDAENIIAQAVQEANNIRKQAQEKMNIKAEEIYKEAFDKGYKEAFDKAEKDTENLKIEAQNILDNAKEERQNTINNLEPEIIRFILDIAQNILTSSFEFNPNIISLLIKKGLSSVKDLKNLTIFVSEKNYEFVEKNKHSILNVDVEKYNIEILKDNLLKDTECIIETEIGTIQCNIDEQLTAIKETLHYIIG